MTSPFTPWSLNYKGYDGSIFAAELEHDPKDYDPVTEKHTTDYMSVLVNCTTTSSKFAMTGECHLDSNDIFKAVEIEVWIDEIKKIKKDRKVRLVYAIMEESASKG